jgi:trans-aconitate 2-methyltransferase
MGDAIGSPAVEARPADREAIEGFYGEFSLRVGLRDWRVPNARHEQLKVLVADALEGHHRNARVLDIGCGTGVMSDFMSRFGTVTGIDFSEPAVQLAAQMVPHASFRAGSLVDANLPSTGFDLITMFDVLEHVPVSERASFAQELGRVLSAQGTLIASTPHPHLTAWMRNERQDLMQVVDEAVELSELTELLALFDLTLTRYATFDVDRSGPQYHLMMFERGLQAGGAPRRSAALQRRLKLVDNRITHRARRWVAGARLVRYGHFAAATRLIRARPRPDDD